VNWYVSERERVCEFFCVGVVVNVCVLVCMHVCVSVCVCELCRCVRTARKRHMISLPQLQKQST
jgi:hypothetical protein